MTLSKSNGSYFSISYFIRFKNVLVTPTSQQSMDLRSGRGHGAERPRSASTRSSARRPLLDVTSPKATLHSYARRPLVVPEGLSGPVYFARAPQCLRRHIGSIVPTVVAFPASDAKTGDVVLSL